MTHLAAGGRISWLPVESSLSSGDSTKRSRAAFQVPGSEAQRRQEGTGRGWLLGGQIDKWKPGCFGYCTGIFFLSLEFHLA